MTQERDLWRRTRSAFDQLTAMEPDQRGAALEQLSRADPALHQQVERLLLADSEAEAALSHYHFGSADTAIDSTSRDPLGIVGTSVSHYDITGFVAAGGMGLVYAAEDRRLGRAVALKFPLPHQQLEQSVKERFTTEARSAASIDHPAICPIFEIGESDHGVFLAMPLYQGETLKDRLARDGRLVPGDALGIMQQVVAGLAAAHHAGIVHRDLKPGNVMLLPDGTAKVLDFGLAKIRDEDLTRSRHVLGTIGYVAPEQLRGERPDGRVDLWAVGVMLHEMLTGQRPFDGDHELSVLHSILHDDPPQPSRLDRGLSPRHDHLVSALLQKDPSDRYQSAEALHADLALVQAGAPIAGGPPFWGRTRLRRRFRAAALPAAALLLLAALVTWAVTRRNAPTGLRWEDGLVVIDDATELVAALDPANRGRHVRLRPGTYHIEQPLAVPDGMTLEGMGIMGRDAEGRPGDFTDDSRTTIRMTGNVGGDLLTLGHGTTVRNLEIVDMAGRSGNIISVVSRAAGDSVSARIVETVVVNPNPLAIGPSGALGRGLYVATLNPNMGADPAPHDGSRITVRMDSSVIRSPAGGGALFAFNFAAKSSIVMKLSGNVLGGSSEANGGISRPDAVHDSEVRLLSSDNLYRNDWVDPCPSPLMGWNFTGGSGAPIPIALPVTERNRLVLRSTDDHLQDFTSAIVATGSRRFFAEPLNAAPRDNTIDMVLVGTVITTPSCEVVGNDARSAGIARAGVRASGDLLLSGAWVDNDALEPGDGNTLRAEFRNVTGSGIRANRYAHAGGINGPLPASLQGRGNRLEVVGDAEQFDRINHGIDPRPAADYFAGDRAARPATAGP